MKNLKISTLAIAFLGLSVAAKAQTSTTSTATTPVRFSIGVDAGLTTGNLSDNYRWNLGGSLQADIPVANQLFVTVNSGYNNIFGKNNIELSTTAFTGTTTSAKYSAPDFHMVPVKAGLKFFPVSGFYIQGEAGAAFLLNKSDVGATKSTAFVYAPQIGVQLPVGGSNYIDAGVRYESTTKYTDYDGSKVSFIGVRVAYAFNL